MRLVGTAQDITERKRAEEQFRNLLESAPDAMVIVDSGGRLVVVNNQTEALLGYPRDELIGQPIEMLLPERFRRRHEMHRDGYSCDPGARSMGEGSELYARHADGREIPVEISLGPLATESGVLVSAAIRDVSARKRTEEALAHQALHDALTGLPNRALVTDRLSHALVRSARHGGSGVAVLFLDLDRFKLVNDSLGHAAGDQVLTAVAARLGAAVRDSDTVGRFGGDEFIVVCEDAADGAEVLVLAQRLAESLNAPFAIDGGEVFLSVSIGVALSASSESPEELLRDADAAMYRAKERGRARVEVFDETMRIESAVRLETQSALHRALERAEFLVLYQPVVDLRTGTMAGAEALVRWSHPEHGLLDPTRFIPVAEESGLIVPIGRWVLEEAVRQHARWGKDRPDFVLGVNLSARQLRQPDLVDVVRDTVTRHGLDPRRLSLELTESVLMEDVEPHRLALAALRAFGVEVAIDDFGTGYSSLTYLRRYPVDVVKIDQSFVAGLGRDQSASAIVESVVDLAHALGMRVVAEGVETDEQLERLRRLGCDLAQGFLFAPPLPAEALDDLLHRRFFPLITRMAPGAA